MNTSDTSDHARVPPAHPLALRLVSDLCADAGASRVLLLGIGSGRNLAPLAAAGFGIDVLEEDPQRARDAAIRFAATPRTRVSRGSYAGPYAFAGGYAAAISTHALLHGSVAGVERAVAAIANRLAPRGGLYATFGSTRDPRYEAGVPLAAFVSAPRDGDERGVAHVYYDGARLRSLLEAFEIESLEELPAAETAGRWAHDVASAKTMVHWFVRARKR